ncbi:ABC transporter ATP-binding protein [Halovulum sp. GXIMD14794]
MLEIDGLTVTYGKHVALDGVSLNVAAGEMVAILGANGAGKSSLLGAIGGRIRPTSGAILYQGRDILALPQHALVDEGIALVPEGRGIFPGLSVEENLALGAHPARARDRASASREEVFALFPKFEERRKQIAGTMSGGEQQMVAVGRALMSGPDLLLLDEPSLGLAPIVSQEVFAALARIQSGHRRDRDRGGRGQCGRCDASGRRGSSRVPRMVRNRARRATRKAAGGGGKPQGAGR